MCRRNAWARSSVVEHCVHTAEVASSILAAPTTLSLLYENASAATSRGRPASILHADSRHEWITSPIPSLNRSEEHTSELQSLMRISYAVFCLKKKNYLTQYV